MVSIGLYLPMTHYMSSTPMIKLGYGISQKVKCFLLRLYNTLHMVSFNYPSSSESFKTCAQFWFTLHLKRIILLTRLSYIFHIVGYNTFPFCSCSHSSSSCWPKSWRFSNCSFLVSWIPFNNCRSPPVVCEPCNVSSQAKFLFLIPCCNIFHSTLKSHCFGCAHKIIFHLKHYNPQLMVIHL